MKTRISTHTHLFQNHSQYPDWHSNSEKKRREITQVPTFGAKKRKATECAFQLIKRFLPTHMIRKFNSTNTLFVFQEVLIGQNSLKTRVALVPQLDHKKFQTHGEDLS